MIFFSLNRRGRSNCIQWGRQTTVSGHLWYSSALRMCQEWASDWEPEALSVHAEPGALDCSLRSEVSLSPWRTEWSLFRADWTKHSRKNQAPLLCTGKRINLKEPFPLKSLLVGASTTPKALQGRKHENKDNKYALLCFCLIIHRWASYTFATSWM